MSYLNNVCSFGRNGQYYKQKNQNATINVSTLTVEYDYYAVFINDIELQRHNKWLIAIIA